MKFTAKQLAQKAGVSEPAITKALNKGLIVKGRDKKFDSDHPRNKTWMIEHDVSFKSVVKSAGKEKKKADNEFVGDDGESRSFEELTGLPEKFANMSMRDVVFKYGNLKEIKNIADTLNTIMAAAHRDVKIQEARKELIPRDFVQSHLVRYVDLMNTQVLEYFDGVVDNEIALIMADSKSAKVELPAMHKKAMTKIIMDCKKSMRESIRKLKIEKDESSDDE